MSNNGGNTTNSFIGFLCIDKCIIVQSTLHIMHYTTRNFGEVSRFKQCVVLARKPTAIILMFVTYIAV